MTPTGLQPIIKWPGGKEKELPFIFRNTPRHYENYYEPFVGGGSVFTAFQATHYFINDISTELTGLYRCIATSDGSFYTWLQEITDTWQAMLSFANTHRELCGQYVAYREEKLTDKEMSAYILSFLQSHADELPYVLSRAFEWHRDVYEKELARNLTAKILRMKKIEQEKWAMPSEDVHDNIQTALLASVYMYLRYIYNDKEIIRSVYSLGIALFVFLRNYAYSGMFRYNADGDFNVPYGGIAYNHKTLDKKIAYYKSKELIHRFSVTDVFNVDFEEFLRTNPPGPNDFIFLDPPYDSTFSTYAQNKFRQDDQRRLADYLINECKGQWMLIIKNTPFIYSLYDNDRLTIKSFDKKYKVSFMNRNDKNAQHLIIMNYRL